MGVGVGVKKISGARASRSEQCGVACSRFGSNLPMEKAPGDCSRRGRVRVESVRFVCDDSWANPSMSAVRTFQITEEDLAELERIVPYMADRLLSAMDNQLRVKVRTAQRVLTNVRWRYGPPAEVIVMPVEDQS